MTQAESRCVLLRSVHAWHKRPQEYTAHVLSHSGLGVRGRQVVPPQLKGHAYIPQPHTPKRKNHIQATAVVSSTDAMEGASRKKYLMYLNDAKGPRQGTDFSSASVR